MRRGENIGGKLYMGPNMTLTEEETKDENIVVIPMKAYQPVTSKNTLLFSTYQPEVIFKKLIEKLEDYDVVPVLKDNKWKLTFERFREPDEEEKEANLPVESCRVQVELLTAGPETTCVEFSRQAGSAWYFYQQFNMLKDQLTDINDALPPQ